MTTRTISSPGWTGPERRVATHPYEGMERRRTAPARDWAKTGERALSAYGVTLFIGMLMIFAATLSFAVLSKESIRLDEAQSLWQTGRSLQGIFHVVAEDVHVPLYHVLLHFWRQLAGEGIASARLLSLLFFLGTIPVAYRLGKLAYGQNAGMFLAFLIAISPFLHWYGNEARMYSQLVFFTILNQYFFLKLWRKPSRGDWWSYGATAVAAMFTHYFFGFALVAQAMFFFLRKNIFPREALRNFILVAVGVAVAFLPWMVFVWSMGGASNTRPALDPPTSVNLFNTFSEFVFGFQNDHMNTIIVSLWPLGVLLGFFALRRNKHLTPETFYFILAMTIPILAAFALSFTVRPLFMARYLILALPSLYLFLAWLFATYPARLRLSAKTVLIGAMLMSLAVQTTSATTPVKENYRAAVEYLNKHAGAQDVIIVSAPFTLYPVEYYYTGVAKIQTLPIWDRYIEGPIPAFSPENLPAEAAQIIGRHQTAWLLLSYDQGYEEQVQGYFDSKYEKLVEKSFSRGLSLHAYKLRYDQPESARFTPEYLGAIEGASAP